MIKGRLGEKKTKEEKKDQINSFVWMNSLLSNLFHFKHLGDSINSPSELFLNFTHANMLQV